MRLLRLTAVAGAMACGITAVHAQEVARALADLSLEQLSSIQVTSVGKRLQRLSDVPGSVYVLRGEDIRRSGATTLPEALRLAPNLHVARADATQYAITARTGADLLANKMLVLIDGRTIYSPLFSGVFWEAQDVLLEDVDRIEILSGSGGTLYGSNAFHGVINVITKSAGETQGTLLTATAGNQQRILAGRQGGTLDSGAAWRAYAKRVLTDDTRLPGGASAQDSAHRSMAGFRVDQSGERHQATVQGDIFQQTTSEPAPRSRQYSGANLLGRYTFDTGAGNRWQLQAYIDRFDRDRVGAVQSKLDTFDIEVQQQSQPREGHEFIWGAGWRTQHDRSRGYVPGALTLVPGDKRLRLANIFAQDEIDLGARVKLTLGLKAEHNTYTGLEFLPNVRLAWEPAADHLIWAGASRVVRTPARVDRDVIAPPLTLSPGFDSEVARIFEAGWRSQLGTNANVSATFFHHDFSSLRSFDISRTGMGTFNNNYEGRLTGVEAWANWQPMTMWRMQASMILQRPRYSAQPGTSPLPAATTVGNDARQRFTLSSTWNVASNLEFDLFLRHIGRRPSPAVEAYTALNARLGWRPRPDLELSLLVTNLTDKRHMEWMSTSTRSEIDRGLFLKAVWRH